MIHTNRDVLRSLKNNDPDFEQFCITDERGDDGPEDDAYHPIDGEDMGWLGYYVGNSIYLREITFFQTIDTESSFYKEMSNNRSIEGVDFSYYNLLDGKIFSMLTPFFKNNNNLIYIKISGCTLGVRAIRQLSLAIGSCNTSLKNIDITNNLIEDGNLVDVIVALSMHSPLEHLDLSNMDIGEVNECTALATLLRCTTSELQTLNLGSNNIDDEGVEVLVDALANVSNKLQVLYLKKNYSITTRGWKAVSTLLEMPGSKLINLDVSPNNNIGAKEALVFAKALVNNSTLKRLAIFVGGNVHTPVEGWRAFSQLLCDTSSVNKTYLSNHTLENLTSEWRSYDQSIPNDIVSLLDLNSSLDDKRQVAMFKILRNHSYFNMAPFFEWEFKVLPLIICWFAKAYYHTGEYRDRLKIRRMKLSTIYDFIKEFPMLYIEPVTRKEIVECSALEDQLQGGELVEIRQRKDRAMRRLGMK